ncbi:hypothetical protein [Stackebrandtia soli]|uniref:hypothetical protein n=1 Tax=Stackebrandtia soli TaxID=1892856 RepID=UPI0039ED4363
MSTPHSSPSEPPRLTHVGPPSAIITRSTRPSDITAAVAALFVVAGLELVVFGTAVSNGPQLVRSVAVYMLKDLAVAAGAIVAGVLVLGGSRVGQVLGFATAGTVAWGGALALVDFLYQTVVHPIHIVGTFSSIQTALYVYVPILAAVAAVIAVVLLARRSADDWIARR